MHMREKRELIQGRTAAISFPNDTTVDVVRVDADVQYNEVMEPLSLDSSTHPTLDDPEKLLVHVFL